LLDCIYIIILDFITDVMEITR
jgi:hypothetical protein